MAPREKKKKLVTIKSDGGDIMKKKRAFFKQRFPNCKKKATELSVLCGNSVGFICYGPDDDLYAWPEPKENPQALADIVARFNEQSDLKRKRNGCDLNDFPNLEGLSVEELTNHLSCIESHIAGIKKKKVVIVVERIKGSKPKETEDHLRVSDDNATFSNHSSGENQLGFGGVFDELGYIFARHALVTIIILGHDLIIISSIYLCNFYVVLVIK
ncbi:unnamed protein product [Microthlaspi erraticum]|uniref:MADS-box domain-containing protein n=1 Tax=Microthlaspi erraticum TaxID=1685480 RepID=A0A6D2JID8_9BRAS|nr:unnamed protein product [Microthlaspi erraticum]